jgi:Ca-activated chloride channel homolog
VIRKTRKEPLSTYHASFYRHKKQPSVLKWLLISACVCIFSYTFSAYGADGVHPFKSSSGQLFLDNKGPTNKINEDSSYQNAIMLRSAAYLEINGLIANVTIVQSFTNQSDLTTNGVYAFPLPENAAVNHMKINIGERTIEGKITEKNQAKKLFTQANKQGRKASLVEQHRPNLFTNKIANIGAHEQVTVTLKYIQHVTFSDGVFSLRLPTKYTPRYKAKSNTYSELSLLPSIFETKRKDQIASKHLMVSVQLTPGLPLAQLSSPSHRIYLTDKNSRQSNVSHTIASLPYDTDNYVLKVEGGQMISDKDFILTWTPKSSNAPQLSVFSEKIDGEEYTLAMLVPPMDQSSKGEATTFARDITFVIDTSGSMQGPSIEQAKASLLYALSTLKDTDSFNIIAFNQNVEQLFSATVLANSSNIGLAEDFVDRLRADGGTEMYKPLRAALIMPTASGQNEQVVKQILFLTDGAVSNEMVLFKLINNAAPLPRLFTVGIGAAPNGYFMKKAAQFGQGSYTYIAKTSEVKEKMSLLLNKISQPILRDITLQFHPLHLGAIEQFPKNIPDLYQGDPLVVAFKTAQPPTSIEIFGEMSKQPWHQEIMLDTATHHRGVSTVWARSKIEQLMDSLVTGKSPDIVRSEVLATSLLHQVMSPYSSFLAVETTKDTEREQAEKKKRTIAPLLAKTNTLVSTPFPSTAVGWQQQLLIGLTLLFFSLLWRQHWKCIDEK